jgi:hypothetical protein
MAEELEQALQLLDEGAAIIQELTAQLQSKGQATNDMSKKAEILASKTGISFNQAREIVKTASESGSSVDAMIDMADNLNKHGAFGKVASDDGINKTGSLAADRFNMGVEELMSEIELT